SYFLHVPGPPTLPPFPYTTLFRSYTATPVTDTYSHTGSAQRATVRCRSYWRRSARRNVTRTSGSTSAASTAWEARIAKYRVRAQPWPWYGTDPTCTW